MAKANLVIVAPGIKARIERNKAGKPVKAFIEADLDVDAQESGSGNTFTLA